MSSIGLPEPWASERQTPISHSFCQHVVARATPLIVEDARTDAVVAALEILPPDTAEAARGLHLIRGLLSFFHRDRPGRIRVITSGALAGIEGTEFVMAAVTNNGVQQTTLSVIDGQVRFSNAVASLVLTNGEQAVAEPGHAPHRTPGFIANNLLQWCFYYPGILDVNDLPLTPAEQARLGDSLAAYRAGDLLAALAKYSGPPDSGAVRVYHAALLLSVGHVERAEADLSALEQTPVAGTNRRLAAALRTLIAAVKLRSSRISPTMMMSGSCRNTCFSAW